MAVRCTNRASESERDAGGAQLSWGDVARDVADMGHVEDLRRQ